MSIPQRASLTQLRTEFTLLIKTLNVLESLQGPGSEDIVISFFDELKKLISTFPPLSLSAYWTQQQRKDGACLVFKLQEEHSAISQPYRISNQKSHDPLNIVKFLFDKAKGTLTGSLYSFCLSFFSSFRSFILSFVLSCFLSFVTFFLPLLSFLLSFFPSRFLSLAPSLSICFLKLIL